MNSKVKLSLVAVAVLVVSTLAVVGVSFAQEPQADNTGNTEILENLYQQATLSVQLSQLRINLANLISERAQTLIDKASGEGKDTSDLVSALAAFKAQIAKAQSAHDTAAATLATHNGFDGSGKVTDVDAARATLKAIRDALYDGRDSLQEGTRDFRQAFRAWRKTNGGQNQPTSP